MSYTIGVVFFSVALLLSVMLHEAGHFATAKAFGMKASRFFVGFGPTLWSFRRGETEYGIKAIPAGGFVKIEGMTALEELAPEDEPRAFYKQPAGQRTIVLAAGSVVHFIIAILVVFAILAIQGQDPIRTSGLRIAAVSKCITASGQGHCKPSDPAAPAFGTLRAGDVLESVDGVKTDSDGSNVIGVIHRSAGKPVTVDYLRDGVPGSVVLTPATINLGEHKVNGKLIVETEGRLGIADELIPSHVSVAGAVPRTFTLLGSFVKSTGSAITGLPHEVSGIVQGDKRNPNGAASVVDVARVSGQISSSGASAGDIVATLLLIVAELNLFVGIFNLLPLLPLDGGHIAILGFEQARTRLYRMRGRRDPGRVDIMKVLPLTYAVVAAFVGLSLILLYAGITNPIRLQ